MSLKILMVDDERDAQDLFRQNFRREIRRGRYEFIFALSADEAISVLEGHQNIDLIVVLSDINMPGMNGIELLQAVRERWTSLPVIMITAYGDQGTASKVRECGARGLLTKPVDFDSLKRELSILVEEQVQ